MKFFVRSRFYFGFKQHTLEGIAILTAAAVPLPGWSWGSWPGQAAQIMYLSDKWNKSGLNSVPSEPIWGCNIISLTSLKGFLSVHATKKEDAGNPQEKFRLYKCATCDKRFPYLYSFKDCQICTSLMNEKSLTWILSLQNLFEGAK